MIRRLHLLIMQRVLDLLSLLLLETSHHLGGSRARWEVDNVVNELNSLGLCRHGFISRRVIRLVLIGVER